MTTTICNRCKKDLNNERKISIKVSEFGPHGNQLYGKDYDLCEKCHDEFIEFLSYKANNPNSHVATNNEEDVANPAYKANQYVKVVTGCLKEDQDKSVLIGKGMSTDDAIPNVIQVGVGLKGIKSILKCGNTYWYSTKVFNKFQKKMWKLFFGIEIVENK